jgi:hypothetical protein
MALPALDTIVFDNIGWKTMVKIQPHRDCFHNSLDICITNMGMWGVVCRMACEVRLAVSQPHYIYRSRSHAYTHLSQEPVFGGQVSYFLEYEVQFIYFMLQHQ